MIALAPYPGESRAHALGRMIVPVCGNGIFFIVPLALLSILPAMAQTFVQRGATPENARFMAQAVAIAAGLAIIVGAPAVAIATKYFGKRRSMLALLLVYALSGVVGIFEPGFAVLIISRIIIGFAAGAIGALSFVLIADYYHGKLRFTLLGVSATAQMLVGVLGVLLCGGLAGRFGWGAAFYVYFFVGLVALAIAWACLVEPPAEPSPAEAQKISWFAALGPVWPTYLIMLIFVVGQFCSVIQGPFLLNLFGISQPSVQGAFGALPVFAAMVTGLFFGSLHSRVSERRIIIAVNIIFGLVVCGMGASRGPGQLAGLYVAQGLVSGIFIPAIVAAVVGRALPGTREASVGLLMSVTGLAQFINPVVARPLTTHFGLRGAFMGIGLVILIQAAVLIFGPFARHPPSPEYEDRAETLLDERA